MRGFLTAAVLACSAVLVFAQNDFDWRGQLGSGQTLEIKGINGDVHAVASPTADAEVHAIKTARRGNPDAVRIQVVPSSSGVTICAIYPDVPGEEPNSCQTGSANHSHVKDNDTNVRFEVHVPAGVKFVGRTVNGSVEAESLSSDAEGHTVNGSVKVSTTGLALANTVNGSLDVTVGRTDWPGAAKFSTVNGGITLHLPSFLNADLRASVLNGTIETDFPITVTGTTTRRRVEGRIGNGGQELQLSTVNGNIRLKTN